MALLGTLRVRLGLDTANFGQKLGSFTAFEGLAISLAKGGIVQGLTDLVKKGSGAIESCRIASEGKEPPDPTAGLTHSAINRVAASSYRPSRYRDGTLFSQLHFKQFEVKTDGKKV
jgi:hypothetical protein